MGLYDSSIRVPQGNGAGHKPEIKLSIPKEYEGLVPKNREITISPEDVRKLVLKHKKEATEIVGNLKKVDDKMTLLKESIPSEGYEWMVKYFNGIKEVDTTIRNIEDSVIGRYLPDSVAFKLTLDKLYIKNKLGRLPDPMDVIDKKVGDEDLYIYRKIVNIPQAGEIYNIGLTLENLAEGFQLRGVDYTGEFEQLTELNPKVTYEMHLLPRDMILYLYENIGETTAILEVLKMFADSNDRIYSYGVSNLISGYFESLCKDRGIEYKKAVIHENLLGRYTNILD